MRWRLGLRPRPRWGSLRRSPDPLIVSGFAPKAHAPRPLRRLKADPPSFFGTNLTLGYRHLFLYKNVPIRLLNMPSNQWRAEGVRKVRRPRASTLGASKGPVFF